MINNHKNINSTSYHQLTFALKFLMPEAAAPPPHGNTGRQRNENLRGKMRQQIDHAENSQVNKCRRHLLRPLQQRIEIPTGRKVVFTMQSQMTEGPDNRILNNLRKFTIYRYFFITSQSRFEVEVNEDHQADIPCVQSVVTPPSIVAHYIH